MVWMSPRNFSGTDEAHPRGITARCIGDHGAL